MTDRRIDEAQLAQLLIAHPQVDGAAVREALGSLALARAAGQQPPPLASMLIRDGVITSALLGAVLRQAAAAATDDVTQDEGTPGKTLTAAALTAPSAPAPSGAAPVRAPRPPIDQALPDRIGDVQLIRELGRGGMGVVLEGHDPRLDRRVAVKLLLTTQPTATQLARFEREATTLAALTHRGIVRVHGFGEVTVATGESLPYLVLEYIDGPTLEDLLPGLSRRRGLALLEQVAEAIGYAHTQGVVHRDLKPANVLVDEDAESSPAASGPAERLAAAPDGDRRPRGVRHRAVVTDFGLALLAEGDQLTRTGAVMGTALYMAPEQVLSSRAAIGPPTDVWALGVMLYELLSGGRMPFEAGTVAEVYQQILDADPPPLARAEGGGTPLEAICLRALARDPQRRYPDAAAMAADLARRRLGRQPSVPRITALSRTTRHLRRRPGLLVGVAATLLVALALAVWLGVRNARFTRHASEARQRHAAGDLSGALAACEKALERRADTAMTELAARCRLELAARRAAEAERATATGAAGQRSRQVAELTRQVNAIRALFYLPEVDLRTQLDALEPALTALAATARAGPADGQTWALLGVGWFHLGRRARAREALEAAVRLTPDDDWPRYWLARLHLERAQALRVLGAATGQPAAVADHVARARALLATPGRGWSGAGPLERHAMTALAALASDASRKALRICEEGLAQFGAERTGCEVYWNLIAALTGGQRSLDASTRALAIRPHDAWALAARGARRMVLGQLDGARADLERAVAIDPHDAISWCNLGALEGRLGRAREALAAYDRALEADPGLVVAHCNRGRKLLELGRPEEAMVAYDLALRQAPSFVEALVGRANVLYATGRRTAALDAYGEAIALDPRRAQTYVQRGRTRFKLGMINGALEDFETAIRLDPERAVAYYNRATVRMRHAPDPTAALADLDRAIALDPAYAGAYANRGLLHYQARRLTQALSDLDTAIRLNPRQALAYSNRALVRSALQDLPGALQDLGRAIALSPRSATAYYNRANLLAEAGRDLAALRDFDRAVELEPRYAAARCNRGLLNERLNRTEAALADFTALIELEPTRAHSYTLRGRLLHRQRRPRQAIADYDRAHALAPRDGRPLANRALAWLMLGDRTRALDDARKAVAVAPRRWDAWRALGLVLAPAAEQRAAALEALRKAHQLAAPGQRRELTDHIRRLSGER